MMPTAAELARRVQGLHGWRRNAAAFAFGVALTLTLAPFFIFPLLIVSFTGLVWLLDSAGSRKRAFFDGWWWGWGFYMSGLYWFCVALLTEPDKFAWLIPFTLFGLTAVIALYSGAACWIYKWLNPTGIGRVFIFSVLWTCVEYARGHLLTGFPWNLPGYSFGFTTAVLQMASLVGVYGLTWLAVALGSAFAVYPERRGNIYVSCILAVLALGVGWGTWRLYEADQIPKDERFVANVAFRLVQGNISQPHKWDPEIRTEGVQKYINLTQQQGLIDVTHVIWPETAVPYVLSPGMKLTKLLGSAMPPGVVLLTGALRSEGEGRKFKLWNSLVAIDHDGVMVGTYDKARLVPFGEFLPFRALFPRAWLTPVGDQDFASGPGPQTLEWHGLPPMSPMICYEVIFPEFISYRDRPQMLLSVTNDAWFGSSTGPYQHFHMARMRAVEQGLPLVRVANTGITAVMDGFGHIIASMGLGREGFIDSELPNPLDATPYARWHDTPLILLIFLAILLRLRQYRRNNN